MDYPNLQAKVLTGVVSGIQIDESAFPLTSTYGAISRSYDGQFAQWDQVTPLREIVKSFEGRDSPATPTNSASVMPRTASMIGSFKCRDVYPEDLDTLRAIGGTDERPDGWRNLDFMLGDMDRRYRIEPMEYLWAGALQDNISITLNGATLTPDYGLPVSHDLVAVSSWADPLTDIDADVETLKRLIVQDSGMMPVQVWCGRNIFGYLRKNSTVKSWLQNYAGADERYRALQGDTINDLFGLRWITHRRGYLSTGTWTPYIPDDKIIMVCAPSMAWEVLHQGSVRYPTTVLGEVRDFAKTYGVAVWSQLRSEPPAARVYHRWFALPIVTFPSAVANFDTTP